MGLASPYRATIIKVLLVGPYPPPYGGLAVQMCALQKHLRQHGEYECLILNIGASRKVRSSEYVSVSGYLDFLRRVYRFARRGYIIHILTNGRNLKSWLSALVCAAIGLINRRRSIVTFGSGNVPEFIHRAGALTRLLIRSVLCLGGRLVCRNEQTRQALIRSGALPGKVTIVTGFMGVDAAALASLPGDVVTFLQHHHPIVGATSNQEPEYGLSLMLGAVHQLWREFPSLGIVIIGPSSAPADQFESLRDAVLFTGPLPHDVALSAISKFSVFLRTTYFDGDSLSVREALALGIPVVASDTDYRPDGVVTFRTGEVLDCVDKLRYVLYHRAEVAERIRRWPPGTAVDQLTKLYGELMQEAG